MKRKPFKKIPADLATQATIEDASSHPISLGEAKQKLADGFYHRPPVLHRVAERILQTMHSLPESEKDPSKK
ncbi:MAG: hypothetical protein FJY66_02720 [Calditrichaeota bacterium]|nr:hypothetical protein [Calditrichota bacterium]